MKDAPLEMARARLVTGLGVKDPYWSWFRGRIRGSLAALTGAAGATATCTGARLWLAK